MFNELINQLNTLINDKRIIIYETTNNNEEILKKHICEGVFRTTSSLVTRMQNKDNIINWNFTIEFAVPVDNKDLRIELVDKINTFRMAIDNKLIDGFKIQPEVLIPVGEEYSYKDNAGKFRDYVTYLMSGTIELTGTYLSMDHTKITIGGNEFTNLLTGTLNLTNTLEKAPIVEETPTTTYNQVNAEYNSNDYGRAWSFTMQADTSPASKFIYSILSDPSKTKSKYEFEFIQYENDGVTELFKITSKVMVNVTDMTMAYGLITGLTFKVVETI